MSDLTDKRGDFIVIKPDAKTLTAIETWYDKQAPDAKANVKIDGGLVTSLPDPLGSLDAKRTELIDLVDKNAESMTSVVRVRFEGAQCATCGLIVAQVGPIPPEVK